MRTAASVVGIIGGLCGIFFAQLVISVGMMLAIVESATQGGEMALGPEFYTGLLALFVFAIGVAGAVMVAQRPFVGAPLLLLGAVGGLVATIAINGSPAEQNGSFVADVFPYLGPILLFVAAALAALGLRGDLRTLTQPSVAAPVGIAPLPVSTAHAELASAVPMPLLREPVANASAVRDIEPGTSFESMEQHGEFVHVRGQGFEGFLPAWSVRKVA